MGHDGPGQHQQGELQRKEKRLPVIAAIEGQPPHPGGVEVPRPEGVLPPPPWPQPHDPIVGPQAVQRQVHKSQREHQGDRQVESPGQAKTPDPPEQWRVGPEGVVGIMAFAPGPTPAPPAPQEIQVGQPAEQGRQTRHAQVEGLMGGALDDIRGHHAGRRMGHHGHPASSGTIRDPSSPGLLRKEPPSVRDEGGLLRGPTLIHRERGVCASGALWRGNGRDPAGATRRAGVHPGSSGASSAFGGFHKSRPGSGDDPRDPRPAGPPQGPCGLAPTGRSLEDGLLLPFPAFSRLHNPTTDKN